MQVEQDQVIAALGPTGVFDITTTGRKTGELRRIEIAYHVIGGRLYISGLPSPRRRGWLANLDENPALTIHLRKPVRADVAATARIIEEEPERRVVLERVARNWGRRDLDLMVDQSPLIEVTLN